MGMGSLKRIAALCALGLLGLLVAGGVSVPAAVTLPSTDPVTSTLDSVTSTVPTTTVRVPSTSTVTTPAPPPVEPTKTVESTTTTVTNTVKSVTSSPTKTTTTSGSGSSGSSGGSVTKPIDSATQTVGDTAATTTGSVGGSSSTGSGSGLIGGTSSGGSSGTSGSGAGTQIFGGGPSGPAGPTGGGGSFGAGGGPGSLSAMLAAGISSKQLRAALEQFAGCLPALPLLDRRVLSMRAGAGGAPLSRSQIATRLGLSRGAVRAAERLVVTAEQTGCATTIVGPFDPAGIGTLIPQVTIAGAVPVKGAGAAYAGGDLGATHGVQARSASPLFDLGGAPEGGPAWAIILFTVVFSVSIAALMRELRSSL